MSKIYNQQDLEDIRASYAKGVSSLKLSRKYDSSTNKIMKIVRNEPVTFQHLIKTQEDLDNILQLYSTGKLSVEEIAETYNSSVNCIYRIINNDYILPEIQSYNRMASVLRFDVTSEYLQQFKDIDKLKMLNRLIKDHRNNNRYSNITTEWYKEYLEKFYNDLSFNRIYSNWLNSNLDSDLLPSLDHKVPVSKGGTDDLDNIQILTLIDNRRKYTMSQKKYNLRKAQRELDERIKERFKNFETENEEVIAN